MYENYRGYWQHLHYFDVIQDILTDEFTRKIVIGKNAEQLIEKLKGENAVAIHIRRGDYVSDPNSWIVMLGVK